MKDRNFFVLAVIVAVVVPTIIGGVYFCYMMRVKGSNETIAKLEDRRELFLFGDTRIDSVSSVIREDKDYEGAESIEFEVDYASGPEPVETFSLVLNGVQLGKGIDGRKITWRLSLYDAESGIYQQIATGNFDSILDKIELGRFQIAITDSLRYKLYYYLNDEIQNVSLFARIAVE